MEKLTRTHRSYMAAKARWAKEKAMNPSLQRWTWRRVYCLVRLGRNADAYACHVRMARYAILVRRAGV